MAVTLNATKKVSISATCTLTRKRPQGIKPSSCLVFGAMFIGKMENEMKTKLDNDGLAVILFLVVCVTVIFLERLA